jgi:hypothetical protein
MLHHFGKPDPYQSFISFFLLLSQEDGKKVSKPKTFFFHLNTRLMMGRVVVHGQSWSNVHFLQLKMLQRMAEP